MGGPASRESAEGVPPARLAATTARAGALLAALACFACSSSSSSSTVPPPNDGGAQGSDSTAAPQVEVGDAAATDARTPQSDATKSEGAEAGPRDAAANESSAPVACTVYMGNCGSAGDPCCSGLQCVNGVVCCVQPGLIGTGACTFDTDCCSGHCEDAGALFGNCCNIGGQACTYATDCCKGLECSNGRCT
jgi:hypothetical protein